MDKKQILVPVDFSETSENAALFAAQLAVKMDAELVMVHVLELGQEKLYQPFTLHEKYNNLLLDDRKEELQLFQRKIRHRHEAANITSILLTGPVADTVLKYSESHEVEFIVVGTTGAGLASRVLFGSVAEKIISRSPLPVIAVPPGAKLVLPDTIVFATNHFEKNEYVLNRLAGLAGLFNAAIDIVYFEEAGAGEVASFIGDAQKLEHYDRFLKKAWPGVRFKVDLVEGETFSEAMDEYLRAHHAQMLVLIPYATTLLQKMKSTTRKMAFHSSVPIFILPVLQEKEPVSGPG